MTFDAGGQDALMQQAQERALAEARRIRNWTYQKKIGDDWVGELVTTDEVPPIDQIDRVFLLTGHKDRMVVVRADGADDFEIPAVEVDDAARDGAGKGSPAKQLERWLKPVCKGQWGIRLKDWYQHSRFDMEGTPENTDFEPGTHRYSLFLCGTASKLEDLPEGSPWARRTITTRGFGQLIRLRYMEFDVNLIDAHNDYVMRREKAAAKA